MTEDQETERLVLRLDRTTCRKNWIDALSDFAASGPYPPTETYAVLERRLHQMKLSQRPLDAFDDRRRAEAAEGDDSSEAAAAP